MNYIILQEYIINNFILENLGIKKKKFIDFNYLKE